MAEGHRAEIVLVVAAILVASTMAIGGCAGSGQGPQAARPKPQWNVAALRKGLPGVLVVRGRTLAIAQLEGATETPVWTSPATATPTILDVDRQGGRIAVLLQSNLATVEPGFLFYHPPKTFDSGIVILSADGRAQRFPLQADSHRLQVTVGSITAPRHIDRMQTDRVTSGAFVGEDLLLSTLGPVIHYPSPGTPLIMRPDGKTTHLSVDGERKFGTANQFIGLAGGGAAMIRGTMGQGGGNAYAMQARVHGDALTTSTVYEDPTHQGLRDVGSGDEPNTIAYTGSAATFGGSSNVRTTVLASLNDQQWTARALTSVPYPWIAKPRGTGSRAGLLEVVGAPGAGPDGDLLLPVSKIGGRDVPEKTVFLARVGPSDRQVSRVASLTVEWDGGTHSWEWLDRFGR